MKTFVHLAPGSSEALDPRAHVDVAAYKASFGGVAEKLWAAHTFKEVPDGTKHGAKDNGDGTFANPAVNSVKFKTLSASEFIALLAGVLGFARLDQLLAKSRSIEVLLVKAEKVDRESGNLPAALVELKTGANALTDQEIAAIDAAWEALS